MLGYSEKWNFVMQKYIPKKASEKENFDKYTNSFLLT